MKNTIKKANELFIKKEFLKALRMYLDIRDKMPGLSNVLNFSISLCQKRLGLQPGNQKIINNSSGMRNINVRFYPDYTSTNPYQRLLYSDDAEEVIIRPGSLSEATADIDSESYRKTIFHLHWISFVLAGASNIDDARKLSNDFLEDVRVFLEKGGSLVWTIHNLVEHDSKYREIEIELRQGLAALAERVHIHSYSSIDSVEKEYSLPREKLAIIPHGNYCGYYPNYVNREISRTYLGIKENDITFLFLGQIRPYKGFETLIRAFSQLRRYNSSLRLVVAGKVVHPYSTAQVSKTLSAYSGVQAYLHEIPDHELQYFFNAADAVVLPYKSILTSGSAALAVTFGVPVIGPNVPAISEIVSNENLQYLYEQDDSYELLKNALNKFLSATDNQREQVRLATTALAKPGTWLGAVNVLFESQIKSEAYEKQFRVRSKLFHTFSAIIKCDVYEDKQKIHAENKIGILILNYDSSEDTLDLLESIKLLNRPDILVVIVDNHSPEESIESLINTFSVPVIIRTDRNLGYAAGNNIGIKYLQEIGVMYTWILNPDTVVQANTLNNLIEGAVSNPEVTAWGSVITYYDRPDIVWYGGGFIQAGTNISVGHMYAGKSISLIPQGIYDVDYVTGASIFCRTEVFDKFGLLPEFYFLYFEETDWCYQIRSSGGRLCVNSASVLTHKKRSESFNLPTPYYFYYFIRSAIIFRSRISNSNVDKHVTELNVTFIAPWLNKIKRVNQRAYDYFLELSEAAISDGVAGRLGWHQIPPFLESSENLDSYKAQLTTLEAQYKGYIEGVRDRFINGWCVNLNNPNMRLTVEIYSGGSLVARGCADRYRPDVLKAGYLSAYCGFSFAVPLSCCDGQSANYELRVMGDSQIIFNKTLKMDMQKYPMVPTQNNSLNSLYKWLFLERELSLCPLANRNSQLLALVEKSKSSISMAIDKVIDKLVSIIMPVHNRESVILVALESIKEQTYTNWELCVCDDGSTDSTVIKIKQWAIENNFEKRLKITTLSKNCGVSVARNEALKSSSGDYIFYLDSDNAWDPEFLMVMTTALREVGDDGCAYCGDRIVQHYSIGRSEVISLRLGPLNRTLIQNKNYIDLNVFCHHRSMYFRKGGFSESMRRLVDWELIIRYIADSPVLFVPAILATYNLDACKNQITRSEDYSKNLSILKSIVKNQEDINCKQFEVNLDATQSASSCLIMLMKDEGYSDSIWPSSNTWRDSNLSFDEAYQFYLLHDDGKVSEQTQYTQAAFGKNEKLCEVLERAYTAYDHVRILCVQSSATPRFDWRLVCSEIENANNELDAILSTRHIRGSSIDKYKSIVYKNSSREFDLDIAPYDMTFSEIEPLKDFYNELKVEAARPFCYFITSNGVRSILNSKEKIEKISNKKLTDEALLALLNKVAYSPRFIVHDLDS